MAQSNIPIQVEHHGSFVPKCVDCIVEYINWRNSHPAGQVDEADGPPEISDAVTLAPSWQMKGIMGQQIVACVAVPACFRHLGVTKTSPLEQALLGGKLLPGTAN